MAKNPDKSKFVVKIIAIVAIALMILGTGGTLLFYLLQG